MSGMHKRAFTLAELLVVISIIVLLIAISVPAFSNLIYSSDRTSAENGLRVGLAGARDVAQRADAFAGAGDSGAVFFTDANGTIRIVPCVQVGVITDEDSAGNLVRRDVFVPASQATTITLPKGWSVRAYLPAGAIDDGVGNTSGLYERGNHDALVGNWVAPETAYIDETDGRDGVDRQTFFVRFEAGSGSLDVANREPALVVDLSASTTFRSTEPWASFRLDLATDLGAAVRRVLVERPDLTDRERRALVGDVSLDTVLAAPVNELALFDERRLAAGIGARGLNAVTGTLYGDPADARAFPKDPTLDTTLFPGGDARAMTKEINAWLEGRGQESDARIFTVQRYTGQGREVTP